MYQLVIFDMDGTLADTSAGILNSHRHANAMMGHPVPDDETLAGVIGGPLLQTYIDRFGYSEADARKAVEIYRRYYSDHGIHEACLYAGMGRTLAALKQQGVAVGLATLKAERFARVMLAEMGVLDYFTVVYGMDEQDTRTKSQLIELCMDSAGVSKERSLMVGDSIHDLNGAKSAGVDFLGVTYGFGFRPNEKYSIPTVDTTEEILSFALNAPFG